MDNTNPTRQVSSTDRWSKEAKEKDVYWLCECGVARTKTDSLVKHLEKNQHIAERIDKTGDRITVTGIIAAGYEETKYTGEPSTANIKREKNKNEPLFPHKP